MNIVVGDGHERKLTSPPSVSHAASSAPRCRRLNRRRAHQLVAIQLTFSLRPNQRMQLAGATTRVDIPFVRWPASAGWAGGWSARGALPAA
jgi:hypothetical protein